MSSLSLSSSEAESESRFLVQGANLGDFQEARETGRSKGKRKGIAYPFLSIQKNVHNK